MERYSIAAFVGALASVAQSYSAAASGAMNPWLLAAIWAAYGLTLILCVVWGTKFIKRLRYKIALSIASVVVVGAVVLIPYFHPSIVIKIENSEPFSYTDKDGARWISFGVENRGFSEASCQAFLLEIMENEKILLQGQHILLQAGNGGDGDREQRLFVASGALPRLFNLIIVHPGNDAMNITSDRISGYRFPPLTSGTYQFSVQVSGPNCGPVYKDIKVRYDD